MSKLIMKARSGVTLVELLVVILIVTILSVSLLPLLKPYIEESKYAAEPIPVLANLQTKIELLQYETDKLPSLDDGTDLTNKYVHTWWYDASLASSATNAYVMVKATGTNAPDGSNKNPAGHFGSTLHVDWQDLTGRRMRPNHFQYAITDNTGPSKYCYAVAVVGDGQGLGLGTGYAVCKMVNAQLGKKVIATWKMYKQTYEGQYQLRPVESVAAPGGGNIIPVPTADFSSATAASWDGLITDMKNAGWEF